MNLADQALAAIIEDCAPKTLLAVGTQSQRLAALWCERHSDCQLNCLALNDFEGGPRLDQAQDLALVTDSLEHLSHSQGQILLGQLRNYGTHQIAVLVAEGSGWSLTDFIGLGFKRRASLGEAEQAFDLYTYNIDSYNHQRDWNNPRFWANPERWGKAWW